VAIIDKGKVMEYTKEATPDVTRLSFGYRGAGEPRKKWIGKWYKPWTWRKYVYVIEKFDLISIDIIAPPNE